MNCRVVVTDIDQRAGLAAVRSLGRAGNTVIGVAGTGHAIARHSRFLASFHRVPDPLMNRDAFRDAIGRIVDACGADVVLPVSEAAHLALFDLPRSDLLAAPFSVMFQRATDKAHVREVGRQCGLRVPRQSIVNGDTALETLVSLLPCALKPVRSVSGGVKAGVAYADTPEALAAAVAQYPAAAYPLLVQERVAGQGFGVSILRWDGRLLAVSAHRRLREKPVTGGVSVMSETIPVSGRVLDRCLALLDALGYTRGVAMVEFKGESLDDAWLIEINPRLWGTVQLAIDAGVDVPTLLVRATLGMMPDTPVRGTPGVRLRWFWGNVDHALVRVRHGTDERGRPLSGGRLAAWRLLRQERFEPANEEICRRDDRWPFLAESWNWLWRR